MATQFIEISNESTDRCLERSIRSLLFLYILKIKNRKTPLRNPFNPASVRVSRSKPRSSVTVKTFLANISGLILTRRLASRRLPRKHGNTRSAFNPPSSLIWRGALLLMGTSRPHIGNLSAPLSGRYRDFLPTPGFTYSHTFNQRHFYNF